MDILYRTLFEVLIRHDYFLLPGAGAGYTKDYDIRDLFDIQPSDATVSLMRDHRMMFKMSARGFTVLIRADGSPGSYVSSVDMTADALFSFHWTLKEPEFENFTNQRVVSTDKKIYYFSNRGGIVDGSVIYLNNPIVAFGTAYPGDPAYRLGDIVSEGGATYAMIDKEAPLINFPGNAAKWQQIAATVIHFVNQGSRVTLQSSRWTYTRVNTTPGEFLTALLFDVNGLLVDTGLIPATSRPQNEYRSSLNAADPVSFVMDLSRIRPGMYRMDVNTSAGVDSFSFYLMNAMVKHDLYAVTELFVSGAAAPLTFIRQDPLTHRWALDDPNKQFLTRWPNRLTRWKYLNQDQTVFNEPPAPRPLTKFYSGYTVPGPGGTTIYLPDPSVDSIVPDLETTTQLVKNIYSNIFLPK